ncbi:5-hydroxytryptamine receptor 2B [Xiphophorus hellerii]|uniref:5-hydroxytryptamine receptor 2B n=1 Tax=Xiphophorus hellerii TaxID=8084 RepID=UPI0013B46FE2|nr:5-hydroxytryptamine receptor 2B [Xiphophorus hellerii]XP_032428173.1 5-hydroxytryptamine receptor 2B [Xiphophorus hellerii]
MFHPLNNSSDADEEPEAQLRWAALLIVMVIIPTIGGNILVILAVSLERKLQNATNYFLMSLAVADLLVGLLVMPIALVTILYNSRWPLPDFLCPIWLFLDVLFSTASIMHLCAISLDRYIAIKKPIQHSQYKSRAKALAKIALVWLISICIAIPIPIKGLKNLHDKNITFNSNHTCLLKPNTFSEFIIFGSLTAFFIPLTIMMIIYLLTVQVLRKKVYLLRSKVSQRFSSSPISTVFQSDPALASPQTEQMNMLDIRLPRHPEKPNAEMMTAPTENEISFRRMSTMGKKSMQTLSNEQRASKVLGIVFLLFVVMWCPFFITNITSALCSSCVEKVISRLMEIFVWVGYVSSGINPLVYTLFNKTFREAFTRYITCNYKTCTRDRLGRQLGSTAADWNLTSISFKSSMAENSKLFMKRGMKNGIGRVSYQSPLRCQQAVQSPGGVLLNTILLTENEDFKQEEHVSCV